MRTSERSFFLMLALFVTAAILTYFVFLVPFNLATKISIVVPSDFRGAWLIRLDDPRGVTLKSSRGTISLPFPTNGVLAVRGPGPFGSPYVIESKLSNGTELVWMTEDRATLPAGALGLWETAPVDGNGSFLMCVGTQADRDEFGRLFDQARRPDGSLDLAMPVTLDRDRH